MGILIESLLEKESNNSNLSVEAGLVNFTEECFSLEEYYNDIYITQMTSELLESVGEKIDNAIDITKNKVTKTSSAFFQNTKNFFIKMIAAIKDFIKTTLQKVVLAFKKATTNTSKGLERIKNATGLKSDDGFKGQITSDALYHELAKLSQDDEEFYKSPDASAQHGVETSEDKYFKPVEVKTKEDALKYAKEAEENIKNIPKFITAINKKLNDALKNANEGKNAKDAATIETKKKVVTKKSTYGRKMTNLAYKVLSNDFGLFKELVNCVKTEKLKMPSQEFKEAVKNQDVRRVRIMLGDRIIIDPTFQKFYNDLNYAKKELGENLFEPYDHKLTNENIKNWTEKSIAREIIRLNNNFSQERINLLYKMCQTVYSDRI